MSAVFCRSRNGLLANETEEDASNDNFSCHSMHFILLFIVSPECQRVIQIRNQIWWSNDKTIVKMISALHSSAQIMAKIKLPKKPLSMVIFWIKVRRSYRDLKCIWQIFFICSIKSPQYTDKYSKKSFFHCDFPFPCFDVPKASNFTSGGVQHRETKNRGLGTIVTSIQDSKPRKNRFLRRFLIFS